MKKTAFILALVMAFTLANAQKTERTSAFNYLNKGQLDKAKKSIDAASVHEATVNDAKTWFYRGNVYLTIRLTDNPEYKKLDPNPLQVAYDSYNKAIQLDKDKEFYEDIMQRMMVVGEQFYNNGVESYQKKNYEEALTSFAITTKIAESSGRVDTLAMYNTAFVSELANKNDIAKKYYQDLVKINYKQPMIYTSLSNIFKAEKDTVNAIEWVKRGRMKFPDDFNLLITETNLFLAKGDNVNAQKNLNQAIAKDPNNPTIHFAVGTTYDGMGRIDEAEVAYKKAISLKPDYFDAVYNLGALYFNQGVKIFEAADKLSDMTAYAAEKEKFDAAWKKAMPQLEKALTLMPEDQNTLLSLKQLYARLNMPEKGKIITGKMTGSLNAVDYKKFIDDLKAGK